MGGTVSVPWFSTANLYLKNHDCEVQSIEDCDDSISSRETNGKLQTISGLISLDIISEGY